MLGAEGGSYTAVMTARRPAAIALLLVLSLLSAAACNGGGAGGRTSTSAATARASAAASPTAVAPPAPTVDARIRTLDLQQAPAVEKLIADTGGQFVKSEVLYADLTGDGVLDAIVPISSGGTAGDIAYVVLAPSGAGTKALMTRTGGATGGGVKVWVQDGKLVETRPVYGPQDPNCCPGQLRVTTYQWNGSQLAVASQETVPNPSGGAKGTPAQ